MPLTLYAIPLSCSLATHIALREAQLPHRIAWVTRGSLLIEGEQGDLRRVNPRGKVPALELEDGTVLTENVAVLAWVAARVGEQVDQRLLMWLAFVSTELHKQVLSPWFDPHSPQATKEDVSGRLLPEVLKFSAGALDRSEFLVSERPSVADYYLLWALLLAQIVGADLETWPALPRYRDRLLARANVAEALSIERRKFSGGSR